MLTQDDLNELRGANLSDQQILDSLKKHAPDFAPDIDDLRKEGLSDSDILTGIVKHAPALSKSVEERGEELDEQTSALGKLAYAGRQGLGAAVAGLGKTAEVTGWEKTGKAAQAVGQWIAPDKKDYIPAQQRFSLTSPSTWDNLPAYLVEAAPMVAGAALASRFGGAPAGVAAWEAMNYGNALEDRMAAQGKTHKDATTADKLIAAGGTGVEGALAVAGLKGAPIPGMGKVATVAEKAGLNNVAAGIRGGAVDAVVKGAGSQALAQVPGQIAGAAIREGVASAAGNVANQAVRTYDTPAEFNLEELANAGVLGAGLGGAGRAVRGVGDVVQSSKLAPMMDNADLHSRIAQTLRTTLEANGLNMSRTKDVGQAIRKTAGAFADEFQVAKDAASKMLNADPDLKLTVKKAWRALKDDETLTPNRMSDLQTRLKGTPEGEALFKAMENYHGLNEVKKLGNWSNGKKNANLSGGISDNRFVQAMNPLNWKNAAATVGLPVGLSALPASVTAAIPGAGVIAGAAPYVAGAMGGIHYGAKAIDALTGNRNPGGQYIQRFADLKPPPGIAGPGPMPGPGAMPPPVPGPSSMPPAPVNPQGSGSALPPRGPAPVLPSPAQQAPASGGASPTNVSPVAPKTRFTSETGEPFTAAGPLPVVPQTAIPAQGPTPVARPGRMTLDEFLARQQGGSPVANKFKPVLSRGDAMTLEDFLARQKGAAAPKADAPVAPKSEPKVETKAEPKAEPKTPKAKSDTKAESKPESKAKDGKVETKDEAKPKSKRQESREDAERGYVEHKGHRFEIPEKATSPADYAYGIKNNLRNIDLAFERAENNLRITDQAKRVLRDNVEGFYYTRYASDARARMKELLSKIEDSASRKLVEDHFGEPFFKRWKKDVSDKTN